jgi:hypothetical protein
LTPLPDPLPRWERGYWEGAERLPALWRKSGGHTRDGDGPRAGHCCRSLRQARRQLWVGSCPSDVLPRRVRDQGRHSANSRPSDRNCRRQRDANGARLARGATAFDRTSIRCGAGPRSLAGFRCAQPGLRNVRCPGVLACGTMGNGMVPPIHFHSWRPVIDRASIQVRCGQSLASTVPR